MASQPSSLPAELWERWGIQSTEIVADTRSSLLHRVICRGGVSAISKQLKPAGLHELPGIDFLAWRQGQGSIRLLDRSTTACLLEDAGTLTLKTHRLAHGEDAANDIIVTLLGSMHGVSPLPPPITLTPLRRHFQPLFDRADHADGSDLSATLTLCAKIADDLLSSQANTQPLHGDLHHENIVSGGGRGWLAIDPQGLFGDAAYDVANIFGNPEGAFAEIVDPRRITRLQDLFGSAMGCGAQKILRYAIAHAGLSICWSLEDGDQLSENENAMERFAFIKAAIPLLDA